MVNTYAIIDTIKNTVIRPAELSVLLDDGVYLVEYSTLECHFKLTVKYTDLTNFMVKSHLNYQDIGTGEGVYIMPEIYLEQYAEEVLIEYIRRETKYNIIEFNK